LIPELLVVLPVIVVFPEPDTTLLNVPPVSIKSPAFVTAPPILLALIVRSPAATTLIACDIAELEVTAPVIFVVPAPETALLNVPPERFNVLLLATVPLILLALVLIVPELVIVPLSEPNAALLVRVTPLLTVTP